MIDGRIFFDPLVKTDLRTCDNIREITTAQGDVYITGRLLDYLYFEK